MKENEERESSNRETDADDKEMSEPKSPWDPSRPNDERWKNTFSSGERSDGTTSRK
jgi:hypothetical protein